MALKPGYKLTEVGVIPEDWEPASLSKLITGLVSGVSVNSVTDNSISTSCDLSILKTSCVMRGLFIPRECKYIINKDVHRAKLNPKNNSILISRMNTPALVGECGYVDRDYPTLFLPDRLWMTQHENGNVNVLWLSLILSFGTISQAIKEAASGTSGSMKNISKQSFFAINIPLPPLPEQHAIATALSDVDTLITKLDQLIAKKRDIKQATMQQLLTGQTRLPGFSGEWEVKRLGDMIGFQVGFPFSSTFFNDKGQGVRLIKNRDLKTDNQIFHYSGKYDETFVVTNGDVLVGMDGDFLPCLWTKGAALLNQRVGRIVPRASLNKLYTYFFLIEPLKEIEVATSGTTVRHLSHGDVEAIEKPLPEIDEQIAIATILSDMDAEITALESRRDKTRALKQGMMQELLTGRIRLPIAKHHMVSDRTNPTVETRQ